MQVLKSRVSVSFDVDLSLAPRLSVANLGFRVFVVKVSFEFHIVSELVAYTFTHFERSCDLHVVRLSVFGCLFGKLAQQHRASLPASEVLKYC